MAWLTKSRYMSGIQREKRLWLEVHEPLDEDFGQDIGLIHGRLFDEFIQRIEPGTLISRAEGLPAAIDRTRAVIAHSSGDFRIYQPAFAADGLAVIADILVRREGQLELIEAKATTEFKEIHLPDAAFQLRVLQRAGTAVDRVYVAHVNSRFVLQQSGRYDDLVLYKDVSAVAQDLTPGIDAKATASSKSWHATPCLR